MMCNLCHALKNITYIKRSVLVISFSFCYRAIKISKSINIGATANDVFSISKLMKSNLQLNWQCSRMMSNKKINIFLSISFL